MFTLNITASNLQNHSFSNLGLVFWMPESRAFAMSGAWRAAPFQTAVYFRSATR